MSLYVFITDECREDAKKHNREQDLDRFMKRVEESQRLCHFNNFPPPYLKKRFDRQVRLLADYRPVQYQGETHTVVNFLRIYIRGGQEYGRFIKDPIGFGTKHLEPLVKQDELKAFLANKLVEAPIPAKPKPNTSEYEYLYRFLGKDDNKDADQLICESEYWVRQVKEEHVNKQLLHICEHLPKLFDSTDTHQKVGGRNIEIMYRWLPELNKLFLAGVYQNADEQAELADVYAAILSGDTSTISENTVLKSSVRSYPSLILADEDAWLQVQRDTESNLALSPEETAVLESVHSGKLADNSGFPLFINGRAGSGKSTILYYLFADYVKLYNEICSFEPDHKPPVLFTCSADLLKRAQDTVTSLLKCHHSHLLKGGREDDELPPPKACFKEFHRYLHSCLPYEDRKGRFHQDNYIDYPAFRRLWGSKFAMTPELKDIGADIAWHIIRTYIKGTNPEEFIDPEEYEQLPGKQKTVSMRSFKLVYERVWDGWYREYSEANWDDQDLVRRLFELDQIPRGFPVIFCDEAQDFTRVELEILFQMSLFSQREVSFEELPRIPYAFAGDPFQTLNPTGFRWDAIQASFHDKLVDAVTTNRKRDVTLNYCELNLNYRSTQNIVRLCNTIQALRAVLFDLPNLRPQNTWKTESNSPLPVWFDLAKTDVWDKAASESDITFIVPCMQGEEASFVDKDDHLSTLIKRDEEGVPLQVLSPSRAKGLEFSRIVLYRFGDNADPALLQLLDQRDSSNENDDQLMSLEYFVNQLYVAASRPKRRLFIIDSTDGVKRLWDIARDETLQSKMWALFPKGEQIWAPHLGAFQHGVVDCLSEERENPHENALRFEQMGMAQNDPFLLRSASLSYENIGETRKSLLCKAHAYKIEERFKKAAEHFLDAGDPNAALECYWSSKDVDGVLQLGKRAPAIMATLEYKAAYTLSAFKDIGSGCDRLNDIKQRMEQSADFRVRFIRERMWISLIEAWIEDALEEGKSRSADWKQVAELLGFLVEKGLRLSHDVHARAHYRAGNPERALDLWNELGEKPRHSEYQDAFRADRKRKYDELLTAKFESADWLAASSAFKETTELPDACYCLYMAKDVGTLTSRVGTMPKDFPAADYVFRCLFEALALQGRWKDAVDYAFTSISSDSRQKMATFLVAALRDHDTAVRNAFVRTCAAHPEIAQQAGELLKQCSSYLRRVLSKGDRQWMESLTLQEAGAAMEHAGRFADILPFYEIVIKNGGLDQADDLFAKERWICNKEKQAERESEQGNEGAARKQITEANEKRHEYSLEGKTFTSFPKVNVEGISRPMDIAEPRQRHDELVAEGQHPRPVLESRTAPGPQTVSEASLIEPVAEASIPQDRNAVNSPALPRVLVDMFRETPDLLIDGVVAAARDFLEGIDLREHQSKCEELKSLARMIRELEDKHMSVSPELRKHKMALISAVDACEEKIGIVRLIENGVEELSSLLKDFSEDTAPTAQPSHRRQRRSTKPKTGSERLRAEILIALQELNGRAHLQDVLENIENRMRDEFLPGDLEQRSGGEVVWRNNVCWERHKMVKEGMLSSNSPRGIWELSGGYS